MRQGMAGNRSGTAASCHEADLDTAMSIVSRPIDTGPYRAHLLGRSKSRAEQGRRVFFGHRDNAIENQVLPAREAASGHAIGSLSLTLGIPARFPSLA